MTWVKISDDMFDNPKLLAAGRDAALLYIAALCYANQHMTDGFLPDYAVTSIAGRYGMAGVPKILESLLKTYRPNRNPLWHRVEGGYQIHDYEFYQPTRQKVETISDARAEAGRVGGIRSGETRRKKGEYRRSDEATGEANDEASDEAICFDLLRENEAKHEQNLNPDSRSPTPDSRNPDSPTPDDPQTRARDPGPAPAQPVALSSGHAEKSVPEQTEPARRNGTYGHAAPHPKARAAPQGVADALPAADFVSQVLAISPPHWTTELPKQIVYRDGEPFTLKGEKVGNVDRYLAGVLRGWAIGDGAPAKPETMPRYRAPDPKALYAAAERRRECIEAVFSSLPDADRMAIEAEARSKLKATNRSLEALLDHKTKNRDGALRQLKILRNEFIERRYGERLAAMESEIGASAESIG